MVQIKTFEQMNHNERCEYVQDLSDIGLVMSDEERQFLSQIGK